MKKFDLISLTIVAAAVLAGCSSVPDNNAQLEQARRDYRIVQADPRAQNQAGAEMQLASDAMSKANAAWGRNEDATQVDHLAYLASQRVAIVRETMAMRTAEGMVASAGAERNKIQLAARTQEAAAAQRSADRARVESAEAQRLTQMAMERNRQLEARLSELNAQATPRGMVITLGDVLFDVNRAELKPGGLRMVDQLAAVLKEFPQRNALVEGFTDSTGSDAYNQALSDQRANAVRLALMRQGIGMERVTARGYGETSPVGSNATAAGRQMNRRVEVVLSDDSGRLIAR